MIEPKSHDQNNDLVRAQDNRIARMEKIDRQHPEIRKLVHDYGWNVVNSFFLIGVTKPSHIKHLVETVLNEFSPTRGSFSKQGTNAKIVFDK